jgi:NitT/TauT family transport system substrate-binding protein
MKCLVAPIRLGLAFTVALLLGALVARPSYVCAQTLVKLRVATPAIENAAEIYYAKNMGFFAKAGLDVEIQPIQSGSAVAEAVVSNAVDIGFASIVPLAVAHNKGIPFVLIAPGPVWGQSAHGTALFVTQTSTARGAKDLNGQTLAIPGLGTLAEYATRAWIDQNGGDSSTVKFLELADSTMPAALSAGRVAAAEINEPYLETAQKADFLIGYPNDAVAKEFLIAGWFSTTSWALAHPDLVARFAAVMSKTAIWANQKQNEAASAEILERYTKIVPSLMANMVHVRFADRLTAALTQPQISVAAKYARFPTFSAPELIFAPPH